MKIKFKKILLNTVLSATLLTSLHANEKFFVVERENSSLAVIENGLVDTHIKDVHNMNHGVIKFYENDGYLISRDGYIMKFDPKTDKKLKEVKTSNSAIGFVISKYYVAVANYDNKSVDILDRDLNPVQSFKTDSRNVGIKVYKDYLVFAQMDSDKITILHDKNKGKKIPNFEPFKEFDSVGVMPFDAMIMDNNFIVGFFKSPYFGVVNLDKMTFSKINIELDERKPVLKVPHFGQWSIGGGHIYVPAVGDNKVFVYTPDFKFVKSITTEGLPVFTALSPDNRYLAVTFSGEKFPVIEIVDTKTFQVIKRFEFAGKVLHVRWSKDTPYLYVSVNDANMISVIDTNDWFVNRDILQVQKPSGIFLFEENK